jgi:polyisoprenoid-binding protein YceI
MTQPYQLDPAQSRFSVQAFRTGLLSFLGHNPTFAVRDFRGELRLTPMTAEELSVEVVVLADSLQLTDQVSAADRAEIEGRMRGEVLETAAYPEIAFQGAGAFAGRLAENRCRYRVQGRLALHGVTQPLQVDASLIVLGNRAGLGAEFLLPMSAFGIRPVTALGGAIRLKDEVHVAFDLVGRQPQEGP